jgi:hypothetical protein
MRKHVLMMLVLSLAIGLSACSDDDTGTSNPTTDVGADANEPDAGGDSGTSDADESDVDESDADESDADLGDADLNDADRNDAADTDDPGANSLVAEDQALEAAASNQVTVASVTMEEAGFVVIHQESTTALVPSPGEVIGHHVVQAGENTDVVVTLDRNVRNGETLYAMLHEDTDDDGVYDFVSSGDPDGPILGSDDQPIFDDFVVNVPAVTAEDVTLTDLSTQLSVTEAFSNGPGWLVIHQGACADGGAVIGFSALSDGANADIPVTLLRPATDGETLCAMLHADTGAVGTYEFDAGADPASEDAPVKLADGSVVMDDFVVTVTEGIPAIRITLSANGDQDYVVDSVEPALFDNGLTGTNDPVAPFVEGWRFEIVNTAAADHPFEFVELEGELVTNDDVILLSQATTGSAEGNAGIDWVEDGDSILFTVSGTTWTGNPSGLSGVINGYRSAEAPQAMRGDVVVVSP